MLNENGSIIVEVPDSTKSLLQGDISMLWEEHICYFTPESLRLKLDSLGYTLQNYIIYNYPQEDAIIGIFNSTSPTNICNLKTIKPIGELAIADTYQNKLHTLKSQIKKYLSKLIQTYGNIVIFGAGHRAVMFINLLDIAEYIMFVVDDDQNKQFLRLPLSKLEIKPSTEIYKHDVRVCIFSINLDSEKKVINLINSKTNNSIQYYSISPDSEFRLPIFELI